MTRWHLFATYKTNLSQLVKQTTLQELVAQLMNLSWDSEEGVVSGNTYQINRVNTASRYMFWLIAKPSTRFLRKFTRELTLMHRDCQSQPKLFWIWFRQFREKTETLPLTIITRQFLWPWSWNPESSLRLARWKRTKRAFHPPSWRKQMKEQFNTHLTMQTISLCCPLLQRKTRGSSSCPLCIPKKRQRRILEKKK